MLWDDPNVLLGIGGIAVGLVSLAVSVFLYFRSKRKYLLEYRMESTQLITKQMTSIPNLKVTINGESIESLVSTTIEFINSGNQSISSSDFAIMEPLGIAITGHLYGGDIFADNPNSIPSIQPFDNETYRIAFDFLKPKQFFSITILHSGKLKVLGELKVGKMQVQGDDNRKRIPLLGIILLLSVLFYFVYVAVPIIRYGLMLFLNDYVHL